MKNCKIYKVIGLSSVFMMVQISTIYAQFATFDAAEVSNTISTYSSQVESVSSTVNSTSSVGQMQQALGDSIGSMSKFVDSKAKADKLRKKAEKKAKRAKRFAELKEKWEKRYETAKNIYDQGKNFYEESQNVYNQVETQVSEAIESGTDLYNSINGGQTNEQNGIVQGISTVSTIDSTFSDIKENTLKTDDIIPVSNLSSSSIDNEDIAGLISDNEFSEGVWDGQETSIVQETTVENKLSGNVLTINDTSIRQPFVKNQEVNQETQLTDVEPNTSKDKEALPGDNIIDEGTNKENLLIRQPFEQLQENTEIEGQNTQEEQNVSYIYKTSSAYAQVSCSSFKTGTTDEGKFIYSDIIANTCCLNFDELDEDKVAECIKTWVMGINDPNAETATEWKKQYTSSLHDHVAADLNKALEQKNYSANFETEVADDLENKSEALTTEREEVSFAGNVNQVNQEIIIRLMEAMTGQVVTEAWSAVNTLELSYYEDAE